MQLTTKSMEKHATHGFSQFKLTNYLLNNLSQFNLSPTAKLVLLELSTHYNPKKADMFPKQKTIAKNLGISERSVVRAIQELIKEGLILAERKYTQHYVFTSKIVSKSPILEKFFGTENLSQDLGQKDILQSDKLAQHEHEPIKEQIKEPQNVGDYKILKAYAIKNNAKNINAYINALKKSGSDKQIITEEKRKIANAKAMVKNTKQVIQDLAYAKANAAVVSTDFFKDVRKKLQDL